LLLRPMVAATVKNICSDGGRGTGLNGTQALPYRRLMIASTSHSSQSRTDPPAFAGFSRTAAITPLNS
jgi:hypothetical protein